MITLDDCDSADESQRECDLNEISSCHEPHFLPTSLVTRAVCSMTDDWHCECWDCECCDLDRVKKSCHKAFCTIKPGSSITHLILFVKTIIGTIFILSLWLLLQYNCKVKTYQATLYDDKIDGGYTFVINQSLCISTENIRNSYTRVPIDIVLGMIFAYQTVDLFLNKSFSLLVNRKKSWMASIGFGIVNLASTVASMLLVIAIVTDDRIAESNVIVMTICVFSEIVCIPAKGISRCFCKGDCLDGEPVLAHVAVIVDVIISIFEFAIFNVLFILVLK